MTAAVLLQSTALWCSLQAIQSNTEIDFKASLRNGLTSCPLPVWGAPIPTQPEALPSHRPPGSSQLQRLNQGMADRKRPHALRQCFVNFSMDQNHLESLSEQIAGPQPRVSDARDWGRPRSFISNGFPGDAYAAAPGTTRCEPLHKAVKTGQLSHEGVCPTLPLALGIRRKTELHT